MIFIWTQPPFGPGPGGDLRAPTGLVQGRDPGGPGLLFERRPADDAVDTACTSRGECAPWTWRTPTRAGTGPTPAWLDTEHRSRER